MKVNLQGLARRLGFHIFCITRPCVNVLREFAIVDAVGGGLLLAVATMLVSALHGLLCGYGHRARCALVSSAISSALLLLVLALPQRSSPCGGCPSIMWLHCPNHVDHTAFHRLFDCLVPRYFRLQTATHCIATHPLELGNFVPALVGWRGLKAVDPGAACAQMRWPELSMRGPLNRTKGLPLLHEDVRALVGARPPPRKWLVLVSRRPPANRAFDNVTLARLRAGLLRVHPYVREYRGDEDASATIELFAHAAGVVGFHGAGFANALFALDRCCVVEITATASDRERISKGHPLWRSNSLVADINGALDWRVTNVSYHKLARANGLPSSWTMSKTVPLITLGSSEIADVVAQLTSCLGGGHLFL